MYEIVEMLLKERGITAYRLAQETGVTTATLTGWKQGKYTPKQDKLEKIADYFDVSVEFLLGKTAFRKPMELFESWGGNNDLHFEAPFDFGKLLKEVRERQGVSQQEASEALCITVSDVDDIEDGVLPLNYEWAEKYASFLGTSVQQIFADKDMDDSLEDIPLELLHHYQEQGMSRAEMATAYAEFRQAEFNDAMSDPERNAFTKVKKEIDLTDEEIITLAAHRLGHQGKLSDEELRRVKMAMRIALEDIDKG